jgi:hypothetical protein
LRSWRTPRARASPPWRAPRTPAPPAGSDWGYSPHRNKENDVSTFLAGRRFRSVVFVPSLLLFHCYVPCPAASSLQHTHASSQTQHITPPASASLHHDSQKSSQSPLKSSLYHVAIPCPRMLRRVCENKL